MELCAVIKVLHILCVCVCVPVRWTLSAVTRSEVISIEHFLSGFQRIFVDFEFWKTRPLPTTFKTNRWKIIAVD